MRNTKVARVLRRWVAWAMDNRLVTSLGALLVIAIPTVFSLFPSRDFISWRRWPRLVAILGFLLGSLLVVVGAMRKDAQLTDLLEEPRERRSTDRTALGGILLNRLLELEGGPLREYSMDFFQPDFDSRCLVPAYESDPGSAENWPFGHGATGHAWKSGELTVVRGPACSDETYGLSIDQQRRYQTLAVVAAMPVRNARGRAIGILTVSSSQDDGTLGTPAGRDVLGKLSRLVARAAVDLLAWDRD